MKVIVAARLTMVLAGGGVRRQAIWLEIRARGPLQGKLPSEFRRGPAPETAFRLVAAPATGSGDLIWLRTELQQGLTPKVALELLGEARAFLRRRSPLALVAARQLLEADHSLAKALAAERRLFPEFFRRPDRLEGIGAFLERRDPEFAW